MRVNHQAVVFLTYKGVSYTISFSFSQYMRMQDLTLKFNEPKTDCFIVCVESITIATRMRCVDTSKFPVYPTTSSIRIPITFKMK